MGDLSDLLGDVYGEPSEDEATPAWADESRLDEVFAEWTPGPPADAPAIEREMMAPPAPGMLDDDLAQALSAALAEAPRPEPLAVPVPPAPAYLDEIDEDDVLDLDTLEPFVPPVEVEDVPRRPWQREDDNILPARGRSKGLSFRLR